MKNIFPLSTKLTIYNCLFRSHLEYGIIAWGNAGGAHFNKLMTLQKKAFRYIARAKYNTHTKSLFLKYNLLKVHELE